MVEIKVGGNTKVMCDIEVVDKIKEEEVIEKMDVEKERHVAYHCQ